MTRREIAVLAFAGLLAIVAFAVYANWGISATDRVRSHFGIDATGDEPMRAAFLERVPVGTPAVEIVAFLKSAGIGDDQTTRMRADEAEITCTLESDDLAIGFPRGAEVALHIEFELDSGRRLRDIRVRRSLILL